VLQCVAVCCSVLQCVAVCCTVLHCVALCCTVLQCVESQTGRITEAVLHMKDPPSKICMLPQRVVGATDTANVGTSKSGVGAGKAIHAMGWTTISRLLKITGLFCRI